MLTPTCHCCLLGILLFASLVHDAVGMSQDKRPWLNGVPTPLPLISKKRVTHDADLYTFSLTPQAQEAPAQDGENLKLGIGVCSCLLVSPPNNRDITRPYTPVSSRHQRNSFTLLVKRYPKGAMSREFKRLRPGDPLLFWQIPKNIKEQYPFGKPKSILMLSAGTGITPMFQALQRLFGSDEEIDDNVDTKVVLLHGCRTASDAYLKSEMEEMQKRFPDRLRIVHAISSSRAKRGMHKGQIDKQLLECICSQEQLTKGCHVWVCGPPSFYEDLCGPREQPNVVTGVLKEVGLDKHVVKF